MGFEGGKTDVGIVDEYSTQPCVQEGAPLTSGCGDKEQGDGGDGVYRG